jgi:hypothetical protein
MGLKFEMMILEMAKLILKQWMVLKLVVSKMIQEMDFKPEELLTLIQEMDFKPEELLTLIQEMDFKPEELLTFIQEIDFKFEELLTLVMVMEMKEQIKVFQNL